ncbi:uncharacterized protein [Rutidosis leptorrhynchoides]|uniref:uncharacterized protein n=1 Tax=Rutidosis leptorrhynchoides TaxID=125765 RepID=UPI003A99C26A
MWVFTNVGLFSWVFDFLKISFGFELKEKFPIGEISKVLCFESRVRSGRVGQNAAWIVCGDFNEVREKNERQNCEFIERRANWFNDFIAKTQLIDVPLGGKKFTRIYDNGLKFSKLDRFLISEKFHLMWEDISALALERKLSDHCPIVLRNRAIDYGPKHTKIFDEWLEDEGSKKIIEDAWNVNVEEVRLDCVFRNKLKNVKLALKEWSRKTFGNLDLEIEELKKKACDWELIAKSRVLDEEDRLKWLEVRKQWNDKEKVRANMARQKSRFKWIDDGDENTRFFIRFLREDIPRETLED